MTPKSVDVVGWAVATLLGLAVCGGSTAQAQTGLDTTPLPDHFRPAGADAATLIYDVAPGRAVRLTVVSGHAGKAGATLTLNTSAEDLRPLVAEIRELALLRPPASLGRIVRLGDELGDLLLGPAADELRDVSHLVLAADGPLSDLPFGAIRAPRSLDPRGRYLIETKTLCWIGAGLRRGGPVAAEPAVPSSEPLQALPPGDREAPAIADESAAASSQALEAPAPSDREGAAIVADESAAANSQALEAPTPGDRERFAVTDGSAAARSRTPVALAVADAVYRPKARPLGASMSDGGISWRRHASRRNQASTMSALGLPVITRFGQAASPDGLREATRLDAVRFLHLALEARVEPADPGGSALLLSPERYDQQAIPVAAAQLASLIVLEPGASVVLSGLDTGDHETGPDPFVAAFGKAGASTVTASLWPVLDESAPWLFDAFYTSLAHKEPPASALRDAQRRLLAEPLHFDQGEGRQAVVFDASHPYYWAGYRTYRASAADCRVSESTR